MSDYNEAALIEAADIALQHARKLGASEAEVGVSFGRGLSISVRQAEIETLEHNNDTGLAVTVFLGKSKASASTSDLRPEAIQEAVAMACNIARFTQEDAYAGLPEASLMATTFPDLSLYHPWDISPDAAIELAMQCEQAGRDVDSRISNSEGASVSTHEGLRVYGNSHGFIGSRASSQHSIGCSLIAKDATGMQRDYWYDQARRAADLQDVVTIGKRAAQRTLARLSPQTVTTGHYPVLFSAEIAGSLFGQLIAAIRGGALYRQSSFLLDKLGKQIFPEFMHIHEQPHLPTAMGSASFDAEGVATQARDIIRDGILQGYVLDTYSARKLGMQTTANAGGVHNLTVAPGPMDFEGLLKQMDTGVIVTETMGMGTNIVTGDYSQGAAGFWVENGTIQHAIDEFTIAGSLQSMFKDIVAVGNDVDLRGNTRSGSVLIQQMMVAA
ncbi:TldE/PmbA protein, part of proposed TldE/TldD proteolytic complex [Methylophaga frappieri]|uniref:TldE/PmbA protein, part of proposed TldE/TldD proteolytic complex n=1 Tax=Methylophaga frappieri (strain ATCC BAA-2434 / DSM 25690 / JAM7) TaxID=754477 RepID=I1YKF8_METFJ|nr:metalloprotease PmbA [Methylophaga frappieri]AFJ03401.1 TldE/PmbA protein, part of proposed TldE/TldD proteolytic complex [Methylophaga frappieri]